MALQCNMDVFNSLDKIRLVADQYVKTNNKNRRRTDKTMAKIKWTKGQTSTKHTYKTKDLVTRTPLKTGGEHSHLNLKKTNND
jgi:hypothetical protein